MSVCDDVTTSTIHPTVAPCRTQIPSSAAAAVWLLLVYLSACAMHPRVPLLPTSATVALAERHLSVTDAA